MAKNKQEQKEVSVFQIGEQPSDNDQIKRYKNGVIEARSTIKDLRLKIKELELEIKELQVKAYVISDEAQENIINGLRDEKKVIKIKYDQLEQKYEENIASKVTDLKQKLGLVEVERNTLRTEKGDAENKNKEYVKKIEEIEEELVAWRNSNTRFNDLVL